MVSSRGSMRTFAMVSVVLISALALFSSAEENLAIALVSVAGAGLLLCVVGKWQNSTMPDFFEGRPARGDHHRGTLSRRRIALGIIGAAVVLLNMYAPAEPTWRERLLATSLLLLSAVPGLLWISRRDGHPFLAVFGVIYALYYAMPVFVLEQYTRAYYLQHIIPDDAIEQALTLSIVGFAAALAGYYSSPLGSYAPRLPRACMRWNRVSAVKTTAVIFGVAGLLVYLLQLAIPVPVTFQAVVSYVSALCLLAISMLFALQLQGRLGLAGKLFLWGAIVPARTLLGFGAGSSYQGLQVLIVLFLTYLLLRHRVSWVLVAAGILTLIVVRPTQASVRALTWGEGPLATVSPVEKTVLFLSLAADYALGKDLPVGDSQDMPLTVVISRVLHLMTFAEVIEQTPGQVPYWKGETYFSLLVKPIPRALWPDKPMEMTGQEFGHRYGFLDPSDYTTSYNLPQLVEMYANFGPAGVLVGMFLLGFFYRMVLAVFTHQDMGFGALIGNVYISSSLLSIESSLAMVVGGVLWTLVFLAFVHAVVKFVEAFQGRPEQASRMTVERLA